MITDVEIKQQVLNRLELEPKIDPTAVGVSVESGVVTLRGSVESEGERASAERVVRVIRGVKGVVDDELRVKSAARPRRQDRELEEMAREAIQWLTTAPAEKIKVTVRDGWLTLTGDAETVHQAQCIESVLREIPGVRGVENGLKGTQSAV